MGTHKCLLDHIEIQRVRLGSTWGIGWKYYEIHEEGPDSVVVYFFGSDRIGPYVTFDRLTHRVLAVRNHSKVPADRASFESWEVLFREPS